MDYFIDYRIRRRLHEHAGPLSMAELAQELQVTDAELIDALGRLVHAGHIERQTRTVRTSPGTYAAEMPHRN